MKILMLHDTITLDEVNPSLVVLAAASAAQVTAK
jgi:hypothetical protein